jgi:hypothetical protein
MNHDHFTVQASGGGGDDDPVPAWEAGGRTTLMVTAALLATLIASLVLSIFSAEPSEARIFGPPRNAAYPGTEVADNVIVWSAPNGGQRVGGCYNSKKWDHVPRKAARAWNEARAAVGNPNVPRFVRASDTDLPVTLQIATINDEDTWVMGRHVYTFDYRAPDGTVVPVPNRIECNHAYMNDWGEVTQKFGAGAHKSYRWTRLQTLVHEMGHSLSLAHPADTGEGNADLCRESVMMPTGLCAWDRDEISQPGSGDKEDLAAMPVVVNAVQGSHPPDDYVPRAPAKSTDGTVPVGTGRDSLLKKNGPDDKHIVRVSGDTRTIIEEEGYVTEELIPASSTKTPPDRD